MASCPSQAAKRCPQAKKSLRILNLPWDPLGPSGEKYGDHQVTGRGSANFFKVTACCSETGTQVEFQKNHLR